MNGDELKQRRAALDMTQAQLAEVLDVKPNTVARWERGVLIVPQTVALAMETVGRGSGRPPKPKVEATNGQATPKKKRAAKKGGKK
jgi:transcriptional regulator with XRE-family HTH domain